MHARGGKTKLEIDSIVLWQNNEHSVNGAERHSGGGGGKKQKSIPGQRSARFVPPANHKLKLNWMHVNTRCCDAADISHCSVFDELH